MDVGMSDDGCCTPFHRAPDWLEAGLCGSKFELLACLEEVSVGCLDGLCHVPCATLHGLPRFELFAIMDWMD